MRMHESLRVARALGLAALAAAPLVGLAVAAQAAGWRTFVARDGQAVLRLAQEWTVFEHRIRPTDDHLSQSTLIRIVCGQVEVEPGLGEVADIELHVEALKAGAPLQDGLASESVAGSRLVMEEPVTVAGRAAVMREMEWKQGGERFLMAEAQAETWKLHISARAARVPREVFLQLLEGIEVRLGTGGAGGISRPRESISSSAQGVVRVVYLRPTDWPRRADYSMVIGKAFLHMQRWFQGQLGGGVTFALHDPIVDVRDTLHDSNWYSTHPVAGSPASLIFWRNVLADAFSLTPGRFDDPSGRWIYYIGAGPLCGQIGGAGTSGVSVLPINDLKGLTRQSGEWPCSWEQWIDYSVCRWVGGLAHELGHSWNVPHPPGCEDADESTPCPDTLMWTGYVSYPGTQLLDSEQNILRASPFFGPVEPALPPFECTKLFSAPGW